MVCFAAYLLPRVELRAVARRGNSGKIALSNIDPDNRAMGFWRGVGCVDGERDQQIEALLATIIPEFRRADGGSLMQEGHMTAPSLIGEVHPTRECQDAHFLPASEGIVAAQIIGQGGRDILRRIIQALEPVYL